MDRLAPHSVRLQLLLGPAIAVPAPAAVIDALTAVKVEAAAGDSASGFELTFVIPKGSPIQAIFAISVPVFRCIIALTVRGVTEVLMDGVITHVDLAPSGSTATLSVKGKDLSQVMNLLPFDGVPYPAMSPMMRALAVMAKYAVLGCVPIAVPSLLEEVPVPTDKIPTQKGTDLAYLKKLAADVGHVFYVDPGPVIGASRAYWGPEIRIGIPQPAISFGLGAGLDTCSALSFAYDREKKKTPIVYIQEPNSKAPIPIPIPDVTPLTPPLGLVPPLPPVTEKLSDTAKLTPGQALLTGIAFAARNGDAVTGTGTLDVVKYGRVLRSRQLVGVRGTGLAFDGLYYVTKVVHQIKRGSYTQQFSLARNGFISTVGRIPA